MCNNDPAPVLRYLHHRPTGLEAEAQVDVGAVGDPAAGGVGQEEVQAFHQVLWD